MWASRSIQKRSRLCRPDRRSLPKSKRTRILPELRRPVEAHLLDVPPGDRAIEFRHVATLRTDFSWGLVEGLGMCFEVRFIDNFRSAASMRSEDAHEAVGVDVQVRDKRESGVFRSGLRGGPQVGSAGRRCPRGIRVPAQVMITDGHTVVGMNAPIELAFEGTVEIWTIHHAQGSDVLQEIALGIRG